MDKFVSRFPLPTPREREILTILIEEAAEIQHRATKALRFGLQEVQPGQNYNNADRLAHEVGDLEEVVKLAEDEGLLQEIAITAGRFSKRKQLEKYMQTARQTGKTTNSQDSAIPETCAETYSRIRMDNQDSERNGK